VGSSPFVSTADQVKCAESAIGADAIEHLSNNRDSTAVVKVRRVKRGPKLDGFTSACEAQYRRPLELPIDSNRCGAQRCRGASDPGPLRIEVMPKWQAAPSLGSAGRRRRRSLQPVRS
jgi:hypothetical protein